MTRDTLTLGQFEHNGAEYEYDGRESLITVARPGRGKSQAHVIRNLLRLHAPAIVLDVKPEIHEATAPWRATHVGPIQKFSFADRTGGLCFNPLDSVRRDPIDAFEDVSRLVPLLMVPRDKASAKGFWESRAAQMLTTAIYDVCMNPDEQRSVQRTMGAVVDWFSVSGKRLEAVKERLQKSSLSALRRMGDKIDSSDPELLNNVFETVLSHIECWGWPQVEPLTGFTTIDLTGLRQKNGSFYLCVTETELVSYRPIIRALLGHILFTLRDDRQSWALPPVTFFLDEFPQLGYMQEIEQMLALGRQPGLRLWFFAQSLGQLKDAYGDADRLLDMVALRAFIAPTGSAAQAVAKELPEVEDLFTGKKRPLATAQELSGPEYAERVVVFEGGRNPARLKLVMAHADPDARARIGLTYASTSALGAAIARIRR